MDSVRESGRGWEAAYKVLPPLVGVFLVDVAAASIDACAVDENVGMPETGLDLCEQVRH